MSLDTKPVSMAKVSVALKRDCSSDLGARAVDCLIVKLNERTVGRHAKHLLSL